MSWERPNCFCRGRTDIVCNETHCDIKGPGEGKNTNQCRICWIRLGRGSHYPPMPKFCQHLMSNNYRLQECPTCNGTVSLKVFECPIHQECTTNKPLNGIQYCSRCPDYKPKVPQSSIRNLLFHIQPIPNHGVWEGWVDNLKKRISLFNGKRAIAILTGDGLDSPERVKERFGDTRIDDWIITSNDPNLREVKTLFPLLQKVKTRNPDEVTFWGHCKGITKPVNDGVMSHPWGRLMLESCLDYWPLVERYFQDYHCVGSFKKTGWNWGSSTWHYAGSFFWFRNSELFRRRWTEIDTTWWGVETFAGLHFTEKEAACVFHERPAWEMLPYDIDYWQDRVWPEWKKFQQEHEKDKTQWDKLTEK